MTSIISSTDFLICVGIVFGVIPIWAACWSIFIEWYKMRTEQIKAVSEEWREWQQNNTTSSKGGVSE